METITIQGHRGQRQHGGTAVEGPLAITEHLLAIAFGEALPGQLFDALVVGPREGGETIVHRPRTRTGEQAGGPQFDSDAGLVGQR